MCLLDVVVRLGEAGQGPPWPGGRGWSKGNNYLSIIVSTMCTIVGAQGLG
jgi:hypothetical protein